MVVASEFYDRRPRRKPNQARHLAIPKLQFVYNKEVELADLKSSLDKDNNQNNLIRSGTEKVVQELQSRQARLYTIRREIMLAAKCSEAEADQLLQHIPGYQHIDRVKEMTRTVMSKPLRYWTAADEQRLTEVLSASDTALRQILVHVKLLQAKPDRLHRMIDDVVHTNDVARKDAWYEELMERRAYLRSYLNKALYKLRQLPDRTPREQKLENELDRFLPLEDFPHRIDNPEDAIALQKVLAELEPLFLSLQTSIAVIREPEEVFKKKNTAKDVKQEKKQSIEVITNKKNDKNDTSTNVDIDISVLQDDPNLQALGTELGIYEAQSGESLPDLLAGDSYAPELPIMYQLSESQQPLLIGEVINALDSSNALCLWIGFPFPASDLPNEVSEGRQYFIDIDRLHDLVTVIAADMEMVQIPSNIEQLLSDLIKRVTETYSEVVADVDDEARYEQVAAVQSLEDLWPAFRAYFVDGGKQANNSADKHLLEPIVESEYESDIDQKLELETEYPPSETVSKAVLRRINRIQADVAKEYYAGDHKLFRAQVKNWLAKEIDSHADITRFQEKTCRYYNVVRLIEPMQMNTIAELMEPGSEQQRWLKMHNIPKREWLTMVQLVKTWQDEVEKEYCYHPNHTFGELAQIIFALRALDVSEK